MEFSLTLRFKKIVEIKGKKMLQTRKSFTLVERLAVTTTLVSLLIQNNAIQNK